MTHPIALVLVPLTVVLTLAACGDKDDPQDPSGGGAADGGDGGDGAGDGGGMDDTGDPATDADGDGFASADSGGDDCDDTDAAVFPGADEICNELDDDCDGDIDEDPVDGALSYLDADGDGYGDPETETLSCEAPEDHVADGTDCGDDSAWVYPGASEICDGRQTDCDATDWTSDAGMAHWLADGGSEWQDMASALGGAGATEVTELSLDEAGTLHLCEGEWAVALDLRADVHVVGADGTEAVVLTGLDTATTVHLSAEGVTASLSALTLRDGLGTHTLPVHPTWQTLGGNLSCAVESTVRLDSVALEGGTADIGEELGLYHCDAEIADLRLGAQPDAEETLIDVLGGDLRLTDTTLTDLTLAGQLVKVRGASILEVSNLTVDGLVMEIYQSPFELEHLSNEEGTATATFTDIEVKNSTLGSYGFVYLSDDEASLTMDGGTFTDNTGEEGIVATIDDQDATVFASNLSVSGNTATYCAGILNYYGHVEVSDSTFEGNTAEDGAVLYQEGTAMVLDNVVFTDNVATSEWAAAIYFSEGPITAMDVSFVGSEPHDLIHYDTKTFYDFGANAGFVCDEAGCE